MKMLVKWKTLFLNLLAMVSRKVPQQVPEHTVIAVLTQYHIKAPSQGQFLEVLRAYTFSCMSAPGSIATAAYYEQGDHCTLWTIERWHNQDLYHEHQRSMAAQAVDTVTITGLAARVETIFINELEFFSNESCREAAAQSAQLVTIMLIINVKPGNEAYFKSINHDLVTTLHGEHGVLSFQFGQAQDHPSRFIVCKQFRDWDTFQHHLKIPSLAQVMDFLQTGVEAVPFEKGYHHLILFAPQ